MKENQFHQHNQPKPDNQKPEGSCPYSKDATPSQQTPYVFYEEAVEIARSLFREVLAQPKRTPEKPWRLDDSGEFVMYPGSLALPPERQVYSFSISPFSSTHNLLRRIENQHHVVEVLQIIKKQHIPLFPDNVAQDKLREIQDDFKLLGDQDKTTKHQFMLSKTNRIIGNAYILMLVKGMYQSVSKQTLQPIGDYIALQDELKKIENTIDPKNAGTSYQEAFRKALAINSKTSGKYDDALDFIVAGINEGSQISVATINALYTAVPEWNKKHPEEPLDFYKFSETEGKKWITLMAAGNLTPVFMLMRGLCGNSYKTDLPQLPQRTFGIAKYNGTPKIGFRLNELNENNILYLQTMNASHHFAGSPRTKCPALGIFAEDLYAQTLDFYKKSMSITPQG